MSKSTLRHTLKVLSLCLLLASVLALSVTPVLAAKRVNVLKVAKKLAETRFKGWTYGSKQSKNQIDCVQFCAAVVQVLNSGKLPTKLKQAIYISNIKPGEDLATLVEAEDTRTKGIQYALVAAKLGKAVPVKSVKSGDFVQYWIKRKNGKWMGHSAIIETVFKSGATIKATIYGSHKSTNGIATSKFQLNLSDPYRKVYLVRYIGQR